MTDNNQDWWIAATPTLRRSRSRAGSITLPFLRYRRTQTIQGDPGVQLAELPERRPIDRPRGHAGASPVNFTLPPALQTAPAGSVYTGGYVTR